MWRMREPLGCDSQKAASSGSSKPPRTARADLSSLVKGSEACMLCLILLALHPTARPGLRRSLIPRLSCRGIIP